VVNRRSIAKPPSTARTVWVDAISFPVFAI
jgi:hypothetical protein